MTKNEQILTWGGIVLALLFLVFARGRGAVTYVENGDVMLPQMAPLPGVTIYSPDYQLGDIRIERAMEYPPTGHCGCTHGESLTLDIRPIERFVIDPLPPRDPFVPVIPQGPPPLPKIVVCKDRDFGSKCLTFRSPVSNMSTTGLGLNDGISSIDATGEWEVFEHAYFQGRSKVVSGRISNLAGDYFQDRISSMRPVR